MSDMILVNGGAPANAGDENLWVKFYDREVENTFKSQQEGRPIKESTVYVSIVIPGNNNEVRDTKATDAHKSRFPKQWQSYLNGRSEQVEGTALVDWPILSESQRDHLRSLKFRVVEQIANATDAQLTAVGPDGFSLRTKAKAFLQQAKDSSTAQKFAAENESLKADLKAKDEQIVALARRLDALEKGVTDEPKRRGRPPKNENRITDS